MASSVLFLSVIMMAMAAVYCEPSFVKPVTRVIHYHGEPVAHYVHSRHLHVEPVHYIHPHHHHHHHHEDVVVDHHHHDHHDHLSLHDLHDHGHHHWH